MANYGKRLPTGTVLAARTFIPPEGFWSSLEQFTGPLAKDHRTHVLGIMERYYAHLQFEWAAPSAAGAERRLAAIGSATCGLVNAICDDFNGEVASYLDGKLNWYLRNAPGIRLYNEHEALDLVEDDGAASRSLRIHDLLSILRSLQAALERAARHLEEVRQTKPFYPGESWDIVLVDQMIDFYRETVGEPSAAKDSGTLPKPSAFVQFIAAVQSAMPPDFRLHDGGIDALTGALAKCLKRNRERRCQQQSAAEPARV